MALEPDLFEMHRDEYTAALLENAHAVFAGADQLAVNMAEVGADLLITMEAGADGKRRSVVHRVERFRASFALAGTAPEQVMAMRARIFYAGGILAMQLRKSFEQDGWIEPDRMMKPSQIRVACREASAALDALEAEVG